MAELTFRTYEVAKHNPFERFPEGKYIVAEADQDGMYALHIRFDNGLGLSSVNKMTLHEAANLAIRYQEGLGLPKSSVWFDLPDHVLEQPAILNRRLKEHLRRKGLYLGR
jgi:hypothetical protein